MTIISSGNYDQQFISAVLKRLAVQINSDAGTSLLVSNNYDRHFIPAMLKRIVDAVNANYSGSIISSKHYDDQFIAEVLQRCVDKVNEGGGGGGYAAKAVTFVGVPDQGAELRLSPAVANNAKITLSFWTEFTTAGLAAFQVALGGSSIQLTPGANASTDFGGSISGQTGQFFGFGSADGVFTAEAWHHIFMSADMGQIDGSKVINLWLDGINIIDPANTADGNSAFDIYLSGTDAAVISIPDNAGEPNDQNYADVQGWIGQCIDPALHLDKFISGGKPVDPALALAAFGPRDIFYSGDASGFIVNQGTAGTASLIGTLTNATTSPSD